MKSLITYFAKRHLITNIIFFGIILLAILFWFKVGKEEMPEFASNWVRVRTSYPGASAEDVELSVTKPIEDELKGVSGIEEIVSTSSVGTSSFRIVIDDDYPDKEGVVSEIKDAILRVDLPAEIRDLPRIRQFKSSEKAILDIGLYHQDAIFLDNQSRKELQKYILSFESQLLALKEIASIERSYYLKPELQIIASPDKMKRLDVSLSEIKRQITDNHIRVPIGSMSDRGESKVTAFNEYENLESFDSLTIRGNYGGGNVKLSELAHVREGFVKSTSIFKINGHEGVFLNIKKSVSTDILSAERAVSKFIKNYKKINKDSPIKLVLMDDESFAVKNRLKIISSNGILGFFLILFILFIFMNFKTSFWVAMGIPFSMAFALLVAGMAGYTVNNMTLAGIIIVLGIVVDDAIIIAENIARYREAGLSPINAAIEGSYEVFPPIFASIITTCMAFIPLIFFEGFFGKLVSYIPFIVILMLVGSLIESIFILPAHLTAPVPFIENIIGKTTSHNWFHRYENLYERVLLKVFRMRTFVLFLFILMLIGAAFIFKNKMKFVMFPREESQEVVIKVKAKKGTPRRETARLIAPMEELFVSDKKNVVGVRSTVAMSRRGGVIKENQATILVELIPADERIEPLRDLMKKWKNATSEVPGIESVKFLKSRWGSNSGSAIELQILENDDDIRFEAAEIIATKMKEIQDLEDVEVEKPLLKKEYLFQLRQNQLIRFNVDPGKITSSLRSFVEGSILYSINKGDEEIDVRLTVPEKNKKSIDDLLLIKIENKSGQLIKLRDLVNVTKTNKPINIKRTDFKRSMMIFADLKSKTQTTPLQIAEILEEQIFPIVMRKFPSVVLRFKGEIENSRESQGEFLGSVIIVIISIYFVLVIMFNSLTRPLIVMQVIPFGLAGVVYILFLHGMSVYGFFAAIGALGMIGVVINDAIVMIDKIEKNRVDGKSLSHQMVAKLAAARLRPVLLTTLTTVVGILPTAYGIAGFDSMLSEMMLTMGWGLAFGTCITLLLIPCIYSYTAEG